MRTSLVLATSLFSALLFAACGPDDDSSSSCSANLLPGDLVISEIQADFAGADGASGADEGKEWIEIFNASGDEIDLTGLTLTYSKPDGTKAKSHTIESGSVASHSYFVLGSAAPDLLPAYVNYGYGNDLGELGNSDGKLTLGCGDTEVDSVIYDDTDSGHTRELDGHSQPDYTANDDLNNWCFAPDTAMEFEAENHGTPGAENDPCTVIVAGQCNDNGTMRNTVKPAIDNLAITEWMPNPALVDDSDGEWFEVTALADVDLNGLQAGAASLGTAPIVDSPDCVHLAAGEHALFAKGSDAATNCMLPTVNGTFTFSLGNSNGTLQIGQGGETFQTVMWASSVSGKSIQIDDAAMQCNAPAAATSYNGGTDFGTPGADNLACGGVTPTNTCLDGASARAAVAPTAGQLTLTEWMPNPHTAADNVGEWFEVTATASIDLNGLQAGTSALGATPLIALGDTVPCVHLNAGEHAIFARTSDSATNGGLPSVAAIFGFGLTNSNGSLQIGIGGTALQTVTWTSSADGKAIQIDEDDAQCTVPAAVTSFNGGGDFGTPGADNTTACSGGSTVTSDMCLDGGTPRAIVVPTAGQLVINEWMPDPSLVSDASGEWFEVRATAAVDLNGIVAGSTSLGTTPLIAGGNVDCVHLAAGDFALFARSTDSATNGGLAGVTAVEAVSLANSSGTLQIGFGTTSLQTVTWATSSAGKSIQLDSDGTQCNAPAAVAAYNGTDHGTPKAANSTECP